MKFLDLLRMYFPVLKYGQIYSKVKYIVYFFIMVVVVSVASDSSELNLTCKYNLRLFGGLSFFSFIFVHNFQRRLFVCSYK